MPIVKRINKYQGLRDIDVFIEEKGLNSEYFNVTGMPDEVPQGKSSFLIAGSPFLKNSVEMKIEMIDSAGQTIYMEPVSNYLESGARRVSIEVYPDTAPGVAKLYLLGELKRNYKDFQQPALASTEITDPPFSAGTPPSQAFLSQFEPDIPPNFQGVYNVRYEMPVQINTTIPNTQPILFYKQPRLTVTEIVKGFVHENVPSSSYDVSGSISISRVAESQPESPAPEPPDGQPAGLTESDRNDVGKGLSIFKNRRKFKRDPYRNSLFAKRGRVMRRSSPEVDKSIGIIKDVTATPENDVNKITSTFVGETLNINNISIDTSGLPPFVPYTVTGSYSTQVKSVLNDSTFVPIDDFTVTTNTGEKYPVNITNASFTASIHPTPGFLISSTEFRSFADITIGNLRTFSGDVYKAIVYGKSKGSLGDFEPMYEAFIESSEVLVDKLSPTGFTSTAYFFTQSIVDAYWNVENGTAIESDEVIIDGVMISGSNYAKDGNVKFTTKHVYDLEPNVAYNVQFNTYFYTAPKIQQTGNVENDAVLEVYVTGSKAGNKELLGRVDIPSMVPEGNIDSIFKTFISAPISAPKMALEFHVKAGRFIIQDLSVRPMSETNFNPDYHRVIVPMPHPMPVKPDNYDFVVELYDVNNNLAETFASAENVEFTGAPIIISGPGNFLSGSMMLGTGMELYGGSAFLRTTGYRGMEYSIANNKGGFMVFSGSIGGPSAAKNLITSSEDYDGVGFEVVDAHDSDNVRFLKFGTNPSRFEVVTDQFFFGKKRTQANSQFVSGSDGKIEISSSNFHLTPQGDVTGSAILLGSKPNNFLQFANNQLTVKGNLSVDEIFTPAEIGGLPSNITNASSSITSDGFAKFTSASIAGFEVSTDEIKSSNDNLRLKSSGQMSGSSILLGVKPNNFLQFANSTLTVRGDLSVDQLFLPATIDGATSNVTNASSSLTSDGFAKFVSASIGGWNVSTTKISSPGGNIELDSTNNQFKVISGNERIRIGEVDTSEFGMKVFDGTGTTDDDILVELGEGGNTIAGWNIGSQTLEGGDLILSKDGSIRSRGYQTNVAGSGFILTAASGGFLEVENAKIRGTLATAVFEKESVNAVGGQLYVANSTVLTSSIVAPDGIHTATQQTMSVVNASGFEEGEILTIKKVHDTGFNTEYLLVDSASRFDPTSDTDTSGLIFVQRGYGSGTTGDSGSLGGPPGVASSYSGSQVVVSTGKIGTGYIRLNANPNDQSTPYIDIVERTGAGLYDVALKARLGDLSGVAGSRNVPLGFTGFGLMSEVAFLSGSMIKLESPEFILGDKNRNFVSGSSGNLEISSSNFHFKPNGDFLLGQNHFSSSGLPNPSSVSHNEGTIQPIPTGLPASNNVTFTLPSEYSNFTGRIDITDVSMTATNTAGTMAGMPMFATIYLVFDDQVNASNGSSVSSTNWQVSQGASTVNGTDTGQDTSVIVTTGSIAAKVYGNSVARNSGAGRITALSFNAQFDPDYSIKHYRPAIKYNNTTSAFDMESRKFFLGDSTTQFISGSNGLMEISSSGYHLKTDGGFNLGDKLIWDGSTLTVTGTINITGGSGAGVTQGILDAAIEGAISTGSVSASAAESQASASVASSIMTNADGQITIPNDTPSGTGLFLTANNMGYYSSGWDVFIGSTGQFLFKGDDDNLVSFNGSDFVLKAQNATLSGSQINLLSEKFYYGGNSQYISGSDGNLEITSSMFHLEPTGRFTVGNTPTAYDVRSGNNFIDGTLTPTYSQSTFDTLDINNTLFRFDWNSNGTAVNAPDEQENGSATWFVGSGQTPAHDTDRLLGSHSVKFTDDKLSSSTDPHGTGTDTMANFSLSFWVQMDITPSDNDTILAFGTTNQGFLIAYDSSASKFNFQYYLDGYANNGPQIAKYFDAMPGMVWHHICVVVSTRRKYIQLWQNGQMTGHVGQHEFMNRQLDVAHGGLGPGIEYDSNNNWSFGFLTTNIRYNHTDGNYGTNNPSAGKYANGLYLQDVRLVQYERTEASILNMYNFKFRRDNPVNNSSAIVATTSSLSINSIDYTLGSTSTAFVRHDAAGLEISSSNFHVSQSGHVTAQSQEMSGVSEADYFSYRNDTISTTGNKHDGYYLYYMRNGLPYTCLYLVGDRTSQRQRESTPFRRSHAATMVRINTAPKFPFGMILAPGNRGGAQVVMEIGAECHFAFEEGSNWRGANGLASWATSSLLNPRTFDKTLDQNYKKYLADSLSGNTAEYVLEEQFSDNRYSFMADPDDSFGGTHYNAFFSGSVTKTNTDADTTITGSFNYVSNVGTATLGSRIIWVKSRFDFRPIVFSGRNHAPQFYSGLALSNRTQNDGLNVPGVEIQGGVRCNFSCARNDTNVANEYLRGTNGVPFTDDRGYTMPRPGSVTAISINGVDSAGTFDGFCRVRKNGTNLVALQVTGQGTNHFNLFKTLSRNYVSSPLDFRFQAGDMLNIYLDASGGGSIDHPVAFFEVTYDT